MQITFLGTGAGVPAKHRNVSSLTLHLMNNNSDIWLFDCGEATQHQILHTPIKLRKINKIFITHLHGDHIFGLPGLIGSRSFQGAESPLIIYGPKGIRAFIETSLNVSGTYLRYPLQIEEFVDEDRILEDVDFIVYTKPLEHGIPSYGFRIEQKEIPGALLMSKVQEDGIPVGPILKQLKEGKKVTLPDGRRVCGKDYIGPAKKGKVITILGDTRYTGNAILLAQEANTLVHEATFSTENETLAKEYFHSTTTQAAYVAKQAGVNQLILNHISSRYQSEDVPALLEEAKAIFDNTFIADDLSTFSIE